ncbi:MAG: flagellar basal body rod protein FlgC [Planctomycetes bacterium]|nr:flagellar basal body rod protein FlgC [Planctomycetota bacterium]MCB9920478.1 flagellar basal body rod protein FlgC [Planctomycetota bacterium]
MHDVFSGFSASVSAMSAERKRMQVISSNIANAGTVDASGPYVRKSVIFEEVFDDVRRSSIASGVRVKDVYEDRTSEHPVVFEPGHIAADEKGFVKLPNVNVVQELVDMMIARRSYGANVAAFQTWRSMLRDAISNIGTR